MPGQQETDQTTTTTTKQEKVITQRDLEIERAHTDHFKQQYEDTRKQVEQLTQTVNTLKNSQVAKTADPKEIEARINEATGEVEKRFSSKLLEEQSAREKTERELKHLRVVSTGVNKALELGFLKGATEIVEKVIEQRCDFRDGKIVVLGADGKPEYSKNDPANLKSLEEFLAEYGEKNQFLMEPTTQRGTLNGEKRAAPAGNGAIKMPPSDFGNWSQDAQQKWFSENPRVGLGVSGFYIKPEPGKK